MRVATAAGLILPVADAFVSAAPLVSMAFGAISMAAGVLLLVGLWTPAAGVLAFLVSGWHGFSHASGLCVDLLPGTLGAALALLGPGAWSVDARLFGRKRVDIRDGSSDSSGPGGHDSAPGQWRS
jgi:hypothetical protein